MLSLRTVPPPATCAAAALAACLLAVPAQAQTRSVAISLGHGTSCVITTTGAVKCWGLNNGALGNGSTAATVVPVDVAGLPTGAARISTGGAETCAVTPLGAARCWGRNHFGAVGDGTNLQRLVPVDVVGLATGVSEIEVGSEFACALVSGGVKCWGRNGTGQLGIGSTVEQWVPVDVPGLASGVQAIAAGHTYACAIVTGGLLKCWGRNAEGQLGDGTQTNRLSPVDIVVPGGPVVAVSPGYTHTCAITSGGAAWCWGRNSNYQLGDATQIDRLTPTAVFGLGSGVAAISAGEYQTCALMVAGGTKCWGSNQDYELGIEGLRAASIPVDRLWPATPVAAIAAGALRTCTVTAIGGVMCNGDNYYGWLGDGTYGDQLVPTSVHGLNDVDGDAMTDDVEAVEGRDPLAKDNDVFASARLFARQQYRDFLFREGDAAGIDGWAGALDAGTLQRERVVDAFFGSAEFDGQIGWVVRLYLAAFQRPPDRDGLAYNARLLRYKPLMSRWTIADFFAICPEFTALYGALDNTQFVTQLYRNVFGREPDPAGLAGWVSALDGGATRGAVLVGFSESAEFRASSVNRVLATMIYVGLLGMSPDPAGYAAWVSFLGLEPYLHEQAIQAVLQSAAYRARFLP